MIKKIEVLVFICFYLPGYKSGGPVRTISNMVEHLNDQFDFYVVTSDRDALEVEPYDNIKNNQWNQVGSAQVFYLSPEQQTLKKFAKLIRETPHDMIYLNSYFDPIFTLRPLVARLLKVIPAKPVILAPRGEFSKGAINIKAWKKQPYIRISNYLSLYNDIIWHASSKLEVEDIKRVLGSVAKKIVTATDLPALIFDKKDSRTVSNTKGPLRVTFLSRISPMKNLDYALEVLGLVSIPVEFNIYGPLDDNAYWNKCRNLIRKLPPNIMACYHGQIKHENVLDLLSSQDLFFLPTRGESYGHVVFEALAAGLPVLISDQTPWRNLEDAGIGWTLPLSSKTGFVEIIEKQAKLTTIEREQQRLRSKDYALKATMDKVALRLNVELFKDLLKDRG